MLLKLLSEESTRVKVYYPLVHTLKSFGSDFAFKDTDLATCASVTKVFNSFLYMAQRIDSWGRNGVLLVTSGPQQKQQRVRIDSSAFKKVISNLRIEVSFVIDVGNKHDKREVVLESIERLLERDLNLIFGITGSGDAEEGFMTSRLYFLPVNDWLAQVSAVREMLTRNVEEDDDDERVNLRSDADGEVLPAEQSSKQSIYNRCWGIVVERQINQFEVGHGNKYGTPTQKKNIQVWRGGKGGGVGFG